MGTSAWLGLPESISQVEPETTSALSPERPQFIFMRFAKKKKTEKTERTEDREGKEGRGEGSSQHRALPRSPGAGHCPEGEAQITLLLPPAQCFGLTKYRS